MDEQIWPLLKQRCRSMRNLNLELEGLILSVSQLVSELESEHTYMKIGNCSRHLEEVFSTHLEVANQEERS